MTLAEQHAADFATRADQHDREGSFPFENIEALQKSGFMAAPVPEEFGGMGLESVNDLMVGMSRLARGCASTAIASNMHLTGGFAMRRLWLAALKRDDAVQAPVLQGLLRAVGSAQVVLCFPNTEPGTNLASPMLEGTQVEGGYRLNGLKIFGTLSPVAALFFPNFRIANDSGGYDVATAVIPKGTPGMEVRDDWDALGMRASGSNSVAFEDCFVPQASAFPQEGAEWGKLGTGFIEIALAGNMQLVACFLGIAEAARDVAVMAATTQKKGARRLADRISIQEIVGTMEVDLATCRAIIERTGRFSDDFHSRYGAAEAPEQESHDMLREFQLMKWVVNRKAIEIVDRAMTVCGGASFMSKHPLSRLYRDVRAGPFMQPFGAYEMLEYIGKVTLGLDPQLDR